MLISSSGEKKGNGEDGFTSLEALISLAVFAVIFIISATGIVLYAVLDYLDRKIVFWRREEGL